VLTDEVKAAVLTGSLIAATCATVLLKIRNAKYRALCAEEDRDDDLDGIPDVYEEDDPAYHLRMAEIHERKAAEHRRLAVLKSAGHGTLAEVAGRASEENDRPA
jgi:Na+:H+ antiporter, NhaA family